ncbi:peptidyl-tRNA hydrolase [Streptomyces daliensis]|uniref:peptidyl-tRNA hydrolase n=1 Tax=Streptomyces daliensis TaxID=299421 RepID=A0A8T4IWX1_9ACTN|nr:peptidyl-tRNA hydrolase [Streptomyces daliensis]
MNAAHTSGTGPSSSATGDGPPPVRSAWPRPVRPPEDDEGGPTRYVLPLVVRIERAEPPARTDALETASRAVLTLLADERTTADDGEWAKPVRLWEERGIRKVVRRARGAEWRRAEALPGLTVTGRTAQVRVFPPVPLDDWPKDLARLQVSGTDLSDPEPPAAPADGLPVLWLNPELEMSAGKAMAQAAHGAQLAWWELDGTARARWRDAGFALAARTAGAEHWAQLAADGGGLPVVHDAGLTEIAPGKTVAVDGVARIASLPPR